MGPRHTQYAAPSIPTMVICRRERPSVVEQLYWFDAWM
jgi:hypothetical protein